MARKPIQVSSGVCTAVLCDDGTIWVAVVDPQDNTKLKWVLLPPIPHLESVHFKSSKHAVEE
jgi:hypothetical protein